MVAALGAGGASASAEQLTAKPQEETAVDELVRIAAESAEFAEHGFASVGGLFGDLGTLLGDEDLLHEDEREADVQRWLHGEVEEPAEAEAEEEAPEAPHACPICCVPVEDHEEPASFACCQKSLYHADCVRKATLPSMMSCPDCGTAPDEAPTDPAVMAEGMPTVAAELRAIGAALVRPGRPRPRACECALR